MAKKLTRTPISSILKPRIMETNEQNISKIDPKNLNYQQLKKVVTDKGYVFFDEGDFNLNIIFNRTNEIFTDFFTDIGYVAYKEGGVEKVLSQPCSTKAGLYYVNNPITYQGVTGVAIVMPNQYRGVYQLVDDYVTWLSYPFFKQVKPMNYWRDPTKDTILEHLQPQLGQSFSTHYHRGSNVGVTGHHIYNWSAGCIIQEEVYFKKVVELARKAVRIWGNSFSITVLDAKDFQ